MCQSGSSELWTSCVGDISGLGLKMPMVAAAGLPRIKFNACWGDHFVGHPSRVHQSRATNKTQSQHIIIFFFIIHY
ncbi:hypothetical protein PR202_ga20672 [Eleusine coracana subsp. coracana]|uniref:Uncharacterized protein n=1 Tax=Eleusine coracana subsp. coracana TaxID=191504 RepID=A0AAV5CY09_ELECO|nr:hypothetical protein PR202_ga20672 [Eleusine coracana subsp. coracana]